MPGKKPRALCPVCQEAMPPDETECRNCGAFVMDEAVVRLCRALGIDRGKALQLFEAGFRHPGQLKDRDVDRVLEKRESGLLFLCTNCGSFVAGGDSKCARCGAEFEAEEEPAWREEDEDILDLVLCPTCGADNTPEWTECEICGERLPGTPASAPAPAEPTWSSREPAAPTDDDFERILEDLGESSKAEGRPMETPRAEPSASPRPTGPDGPEPAARALPPRTEEPPPAPDPRPLPAPAAPKARPQAEPRHVPTAARPSAPPGPARPSSDRIVRRPAEILVRPARARGSPHRADAPGLRDLMGPAVAAAGISLYASSALGQRDVAWAIAFVLAAILGYAATAWVPMTRARVPPRHGLLLVAGALLSAAAPALGSLVPDVPPALPGALSVAGALPLAAAARRLLPGPHRSLVAAASAVPLIVLAAAAGQGVGYASSAAWTVGILAILPWPSALAAAEVRDRALARGVREEILRAERDYAREDYARSVEDYDRAIELSEQGSRPEDLPWYGKGAALVILGRYEEALEAIDRALDINPRNEVAWVNKGNALTKLGRLVDALRCFNAAIKVNPGYEVAWNNKGNALARLGRFEEALRCYDRALDLDVGYRGAWVNKGYVLAKLGRFDEAAACADRVLRLEDSRRAGAA